MSVLVNGTEDLPQGLTPAQAYGSLNSTVQKLALMNLHEQVVAFFGLVRDGITRGQSAISIERLCTAVELRIEGDPPSVNPLIAQININGALQSQQFTVAAGSNYALVAVNSGGLVIAANNYAAIQITAANGAGDVVVTLKSQLRIL